MKRQASEFLSRAQVLHSLFHPLEITHQTAPTVLSVATPALTLQELPGLLSVQKLLLERVVLPMKFPELFRGVRRGVQTILLYGPSGSGKSMLVSACAGEAHVPLYTLSPAELMRNPEAEKSVRATFLDACVHSPAIIWISEVNTLCRDDQSEHEGWPRRLYTELLIGLDNLHRDRSVLSILMTSNAPWHLSNPLRRRIDQEVYIPLPDAVRRRAMLYKEVQLPGAADYSLAADLSEGLSFWDIRRVIRTASGEAQKSNRNTIIGAIRAASYGVDVNMLERFQTYVCEHSG